MKLKEINAEERPRERLLSKGAQALGNTELLAILLRTGNRGKNVLETSTDLLCAAGSLTELASMSPDKLMSFTGIGKDKATTICAAFELGRRFSAESSGAARTAITHSRQIYEMMIPLLKGLDHEECWIIFLNRSNYVLSKEKLSFGGLTSTTLDPNSILRKAIEKKADGLILIHNHPSGNPQPSAADIKETTRLKNASIAFGISMLDHIVISDNSYYSFSDEMIVDAATT